MLSGMISSVSPNVYSDTIDDNIGIGEGIAFHTDATDNIAIGENALNNTTGAALYNIAIGTNALTDLTAGDNNTAIGYNALKDQTTPVNNTAIGSNAGKLITSSNNTIVGYSALDGATTAAENTVIGVNAMGTIPTGQAVSKCVAIGNLAFTGSADTTTAADGTVAIGYDSLNNLETGQYNTAIGYQSANALTDADGCIAIGYNAMLVHTGGADASGNHNIAIGYGAMDNNDQSDATLTSNNNIFMGVSSGGGEWTTAACNHNVAIGSYTMIGDMNGAEDNVAIGYQSLEQVTTGDKNVASGKFSGTEILAGIGNVCVGYAAGNTITDGHFNTSLGYQSDCHATYSNQIAIGNTAVTSAANAIALGDTITNSTTETFMWGASGKTVITTDFDTSSVAFSQSSDIRKKTNIKDATLGLEFINKLRNVSFQWKPQNEYPEEWEAYSKENTVDTETVRYGFIAQEVKQALEECNVDISTKDGIWSQDSDGMQRLANAKLVLPLVKAVQELSAEVEELKTKIGEA